MAVSLREREMLKGALARYVSREIAEQVLAENGPSVLAGKRREITVCIVDIRNFTALSSKLPPEDVVRFLNDFNAFDLRVRCLGIDPQHSSRHHEGK